MDDGGAVDHLLHDLAHAEPRRELILTGLERLVLAIDAHAGGEDERIGNHAGVRQLVGDRAHAQPAIDDDGGVGERRPRLVKLVEAPIGRSPR